MAHTVVQLPNANRMQQVTDSWVRHSDSPVQENRAWPWEDADGHIPNSGLGLSQFSSKQQSKIASDDNIAEN